MRAVLSAVTLLVWLSSAAIAGPKDVDAIVKLHAPDALFMGTASKTVVVKTEGIRTYFENALLNNRPRGAKLRQ